MRVDLDLRQPDPTPIADAVRETLTAAMQSVPEGKRGALLIRADADGNAVAHLAWKANDVWTVAAGGGINIHERRPYGYVAVEASW